MFVTGIDTGETNAYTTVLVEPARTPEFVDCGTFDYDGLIGFVRSGVIDGHVIGIERSMGFYPSDAKNDSSGAKLAGVAKDLLVAAYIAGEVYGRVLERGARAFLIPVKLAREQFGVKFGAQRGRSGIAADETANQQISRIIPDKIHGWPAPRKTNNHERDAGVLAWFTPRYAAVHGKLVI